MSEKKKPTGIDLQETVQQTADYYRNMIAENEAMKSELEASKRIIWAMCNAKGGVIRVPDRVMAQANDSANSIDSSYDSKGMCTVLKSVTMGRKKGLSIIE